MDSPAVATTDRKESEPTSTLQAMRKTRSVNPTLTMKINSVRVPRVDPPEMAAQETERERLEEINILQATPYRGR